MELRYFLARFAANLIFIAEIQVGPVPGEGFDSGEWRRRTRPVRWTGRRKTMGLKTDGDGALATDHNMTK